jgi:hypothetical protein
LFPHADVAQKWVNLLRGIAGAGPVGYHTFWSFRGKKPRRAGMLPPSVRKPKRVIRKDNDMKPNAEFHRCELCEEKATSTAYSYSPSNELRDQHRYCDFHAKASGLFADPKAVDIHDETLGPIQAVVDSIKRDVPVPTPQEGDGTNDAAQHAAIEKEDADMALTPRSSRCDLCAQTAPVSIFTYTTSGDLRERHHYCEFHAKAMGR